MAVGAAARTTPGDGLPSGWRQAVANRDHWLTAVVHVPTWLVFAAQF